MRFFVYFVLQFHIKNGSPGTSHSEKKSINHRGKKDLEKVRTPLRVEEGWKNNRWCNEDAEMTFALKCSEVGKARLPSSVTAGETGVGRKGCFFCSPPAVATRENRG